MKMSKKSSKCVKIQLLDKLPSCCTINDTKLAFQEIMNFKMLEIVIISSEKGVKITY